MNIASWVLTNRAHLTYSVLWCLAMIVLFKYQADLPQWLVYALFAALLAINLALSIWERKKRERRRLASQPT